MKRRAFITLLGGAAATWPLVARAQHGERVRRIDVLMNAPESDPSYRSYAAAFAQTLQRVGRIISHALLGGLHHHYVRV